ncbi:MULTISPECIES: hypothetical protein [Micromonospora]|uniref:hypothetical protein n=1 Tax=Micromonospora TaxID=1873 RepID=UPI0007DB0D97|nr:MULTISPECIES: hypothetical protein [Micromonospora]
MTATDPGRARRRKMLGYSPEEPEETSTTEEPEETGVPALNDLLRALTPAQRRRRLMLGLKETD